MDVDVTRIMRTVRRSARTRSSAPLARSVSSGVSVIGRAGRAESLPRRIVRRGKRLTAWLRVHFGRRALRRFVRSDIFKVAGRFQKTGKAVGFALAAPMLGFYVRGKIAWTLLKRREEASERLAGKVEALSSKLARCEREIEALRRGDAQQARPSSEARISSPSGREQANE